MKIVIEQRGNEVMINFDGKHKPFDRIRLLMLATAETLVDSIRPNLTDEQLQTLAWSFGASMKDSAIALYKLDAHDRKTEFTGKEAAFLSKLFGM